MPMPIAEAIAAVQKAHPGVVVVEGPEIGSTSEAEGPNDTMSLNEMRVAFGVEGAEADLARENAERAAGVVHDLGEVVYFSPAGAIGSQLIQLMAIVKDGRIIAERG